MDVASPESLGSLELLVFKKFIPTAVYIFVPPAAKLGELYCARSMPLLLLKGMINYPVDEGENTLSKGGN
jgi:hypothetical protein